MGCEGLFSLMLKFKKLSWLYPKNISNKPKKYSLQLWENVWFGPAQENLSWRNLCIVEVKSIYFLNNLSGHSVTCNLRSHFLRWLWNAPDAQCDGLDKAAEGEMQKAVPLTGRHEKPLKWTACRQSFPLMLPLLHSCKEKTDPSWVLPKDQLVVTGELPSSNPVGLISPIPHLRLKFH